MNITADRPIPSGSTAVHPENVPSDAYRAIRNRRWQREQPDTLGPFWTGRPTTHNSRLGDDGQPFLTVRVGWLCGCTRILYWDGLRWRYGMNSTQGACPNHRQEQMAKHRQRQDNYLKKRGFKTWQELTDHEMGRARATG